MKSWDKPTPELVDRAGAKLGRVAAQRHFFQQLQNPEWLEPLRKRGWFKTPPPAQRDEASGTVAFPPWPPSVFLIRMAAERPDAVAAILDEVPKTDNVRIYDDLAEIACHLPAKFAARIAQRAQEWVGTTPVLLLSDHLANLVAHLAVPEHADAAFSLAAAILRTRSAPKQASGDLAEFAQSELVTEAQPWQEIWDYKRALQKCIPALLSVDARRVITLVSELLETAIRSGHGRK